MKPMFEEKAIEAMRKLKYFYFAKKKIFLAFSSPRKCGPLSPSQKCGSLLLPSNTHMWVFTEEEQ